MSPEPTPDTPRADRFAVAGREYSSRLLVGTGKYKDLEQTRQAIEASGAEIVTVAVRRTNLGQNPGEPNILDILPPDRYTILPNTADPIVARRLEEIGCVAVMPLAAPIGSGLGIRNPLNIRTIVENARVPVLVDAGVGTASDAAVAMELGCDGVLMNTAIAAARDPILMASAMRKAIEAGREAYLAGRMAPKRFASASSPIEGLFY
jgi:thiazole synthase ThiGH ThiG subunit